MPLNHACGAVLFGYIQAGLPGIIGRWIVYLLYFDECRLPCFEADCFACGR